MSKSTDLRHRYCSPARDLGPAVLLLAKRASWYPGVGKILVGMTPGDEDRTTSGGAGTNMEWVVKLEAKTGWGGVETIEVGKIERRVVGLTAEEIGLTLAEGKDLLAELAYLILQTQMKDFATCARVCTECLKLRRLRNQVADAR